MEGRAVPACAESCCMASAGAERPHPDRPGWSTQRSAESVEPADEMGPPVADAVAADMPAQRGAHAGNTVQHLCHSEAADRGQRSHCCAPLLSAGRGLQLVSAASIGILETAGGELQCDSPAVLSEKAWAGGCWQRTAVLLQCAAPCSVTGQAAGRARQRCCHMALLDLAHHWPAASLWYGTYAQPQNGIGRLLAEGLESLPSTAALSSIT